MKRLLAFICLAAVLTCGVLFAACDSENNVQKKEEFVNPGDNLGGGGTGEEANSVDTTEIENQINSSVDGDLSDLSQNIDSDGATTLEASTSEVEITAAGTYVLSGEYSGGVSVKKNLGEVHLILNSATISRENEVALKSKAGTSLIITVNADTENSITNSGVDSDNETVNALSVKSDLSINGTGTLTVTSESKNAVKVDGALSVVGATLVVSASNNAISAYSVTAEDCTINVTSAAKDGIHAEMDDSVTEYTTSDGFVSLKDVTYTCSVSGDGIQADTFVYINGGTYNISTEGEFVSYSTSNMETFELEADDFRYVKSGSSYKKVASDETVKSSSYALAQSCKGIKVGEIDYETDDGTEVTITDGDYALMIVDGTFTFDTTDDSLHCNGGDMFVRGGTLTISTLDDGLTADGDLKISGGTIDITTCYEGVEGATVEISGGTINIVAEDDGINAASDDSSATIHIIISGGVITVDAEGDGIDSNGSVMITGGTTTVYGPTNGGNGGLDSETGVLVNGGTLFVTSALGMVETPAQNSEQYVVSYASKSNVTAGTMFYVLDSDGNTVIEVEIQKACQSLIFSSADLENGETYTIYGGDTELATFTISSIITSVGSATQSNNPGGSPGGNMGGGGRGGR